MEERHVEITPIALEPYRFYRVMSAQDRAHSRIGSHLFSPGEMLEIAAYVQANRAQLEQEAREDEERNQRAWSQDRVDMQRMEDDWRHAATSDDETPGPRLL